MRDTMTVLLEPAPKDACDGSASFLQSGFWGDFKAGFGWKPLHFTLESGGRRSPLLVLLRGLGKGLSFAYVPHGPALEPGPGEAAALLAGIGEALKDRLPATCLFVRFDPPWRLIEATADDGGADDGDRAGAAEAATPLPGQAAEGQGSPLPGQPAGGQGSRRPREPQRPPVGAPLRRAAADIQPPDTVLLDLSRSEEDILQGMKPKWRYNVRLAEKKGVAVEELAGEAALASLPEFYRLYVETSERDRIALHPEAYYAGLFSLSRTYDPEGGRRPDLRLWMARHEGQALASIITVFRGEEAVYLYGASSGEKRNLMPAYALQWAAIRAAKASGATVYDFYGIPPVDDPSHPMSGLYRFKTGFGGEIAHRAGSWDYPLRPVAYAAFRAAEAARTWWFKDFRKRAGGRGERGAAKRTE